MLYKIAYFGIFGFFSFNLHDILGRAQDLFQQWLTLHIHDLLSSRCRAERDFGEDFV